MRLFGGKRGGGDYGDFMEGGTHKRETWSWSSRDNEMASRAEIRLLLGSVEAKCSDLEHHVAADRRARVVLLERLRGEEHYVRPLSARSHTKLESWS
jgi:hypothetical protein